MNRADLLSTALDAVNKRPKAYGPPEQNFERIARLWTDHMLNRYGESTMFDGVDVAVMMALMKIARLEETPDHDDSWVDLAGYAACGSEVAAALFAEADEVIEHDPDEHIERGKAETGGIDHEPLPYWRNKPSPRFKVGDQVRVYLTDGSSPADPVYEVRSVTTLDDGTPGYTLGRPGRPGGWVPWRESALEPVPS